MYFSRLNYSFVNNLGDYEETVNFRNDAGYSTFCFCR